MLIILGFAIAIGFKKASPENSFFVRFGRLCLQMFVQGLKRSTEIFAGSQAVFILCLTLALWEFSWTIWKHRNETLHDRTGVDQIPQRELNASVTQEWQNGDTELLPQDKALIQGTSLPQLLQTSQDHKLAGLAQIRLARLAYASTEDGDESTDIDSDTSDTTAQDP
jgi:hypothetical protein